MSIELKTAAQQALKALEAISDEMTVGERYTNAGQYLLDALGPLRAALSQQAEAQQPATTEPVAWNSIQIASWIGSQLMHEPSMFERATVCKFVRSLGRHPTLIKHSPKIHTAPTAQAHPAELTDEQILEVAEPFGAFEYGDAQGDKRIDFARAVLALRPERVPMTDEQIRSMCKQGWVFETARQWVRVIEAHHGIKAHD